MSLGMSQSELAEKTGYKSRSSINKIELGINDVPQSKIKVFADALDTSIEYLMDWEEKEPTEVTVGEFQAKALELLNRVPEENQPFVLSLIEAAINNLK